MLPSVDCLSFVLINDRQGIRFDLRASSHCSRFGSYSEAMSHNLGSKPYLSDSWACTFSSKRRRTYSGNHRARFLPTCVNISAAWNNNNNKKQANRFLVEKTLSRKKTFPLPPPPSKAGLASCANNAAAAKCCCCDGRCCCSYTHDGAGAKANGADFLSLIRPRKVYFPPASSFFSSLSLPGHFPSFWVSLIYIDLATA